MVFNGILAVAKFVSDDFREIRRDSDMGSHFSFLISFFELILTIVVPYECWLDKEKEFATAAFVFGIVAKIVSTGVLEEKQTARAGFCV